MPKYSISITETVARDFFSAEIEAPDPTTARDFVLRMARDGELESHNEAVTDVRAVVFSGGACLSDQQLDSYPPQAS